MNKAPSTNRFAGGVNPARWVRVFLFLLLLCFSPSAFADDISTAEPVTAEQVVVLEEKVAVENGEQEEHKLSPNAPVVFSVGKVPVTSSMITGWLAAFVLLAAAIRFHIQMKAGKNTRFTATVEALVVFLSNFLADIMGEKLARRTFWLLGAFFVYILTANLLGLFPGIGSVGWGHDAEHHFMVTTPLFRGVNADLNTTLALGALFFVFWFIWAWKANGPVGLLKHIFGFSGEATGIMHFVMVIVFLAVGFLELLSILIRPFSLALRLYGNIFAGEVVLETMMHKVPMLSWLLPVPFYLMEVLVGLIQSLVFTLLSAVFIMLICSHEEKETPPEKGPEAS
ncbi:MAG: F0F1 ATP synthase subunit A [Pontiellaceae bacterium]|nr:F0F1 ATP synthase subunit A [Pontiellaceae bacterium]MBN2783201.1 F0F1 ATP synthase subunit A [Pontiellaceae bacterium]